MAGRPRLLERVRRVATEAAAPVVSRLAEGAVKAAELAGERARRRNRAGRASPVEQLAQVAEALTREAQRRLERVSHAADRAGARGVETLGEVAGRGTQAEVALRQGRVVERVRELGEELARRGQQGLEEARQRGLEVAERMGVPGTVLENLVGRRATPAPGGEAASRQEEAPPAHHDVRPEHERMGVHGVTLGEAVAKRNAQVEAELAPPPLGPPAPREAPAPKRRKTAPRAQAAPKEVRARPAQAKTKEPIVVVEEGFKGKRGQKHKH